MARADSIPPFPADIDREAFGHWLSGFTDGEGCFQLRVAKRARGIPLPSCNFCIELRADDLDVLQLIRSYFGCGAIFHTDRDALRKTGLKHYDSFRFSISRITDLASVIVPHFEAFPLRAKKANDFSIWKQGVLFSRQVASHPRQGAGMRHGSRPRWTESRLAHFYALAQALRDARKSGRPSKPLPLPPCLNDRTLFDPPD